MSHIGKIRIYSGPMFAGKTSALIREFKTTDNAIAIRPQYDTRWETLSSHDGDSIPSVSASSVYELDAIVKKNPLTEYFLFDEIHFFGNPMFEGDILQYLLKLKSQGKSSCVFGLDYNWKGEHFELTHLISKISDEHIKLTGQCSCGRPSVRTMKSTPSTGIFDIGATDLYSPACLSCFKVPV